MAIGGRINRTLQKRSKSQKVKRKRATVGAVVDRNLIAVHQLKKRCLNKRAVITLSGKQRRKLRKQMQNSQRELFAMEVESAPQGTRQETGTKAKNGETVQKVEVLSVEMKEQEGTPQPV
ncbi:uncharacterized protein C11orf98 homolog [Narcine bancroftii]|uniref:uncharacterized protein C11orf98 homolog n=1 Tax=Narcine bancroftii TaxID=1343680 RepID=UPI003831001D